MSSCECMGSIIPGNVVQCKSCSSCNGNCNAEANKIMTQKRIWKQVRVPSSLFTMAKQASTIISAPSNLPTVQYFNLNWNQSSDRNIPSIQYSIVPSHGNSTRRSVTRLRPGSMSPGGKGVDIKHNSYDRYLARRKSIVVKNQGTTNLSPLYGDKTRSIGILSATCVKCNNQ